MTETSDLHVFHVDIKKVQAIKTSVFLLLVVFFFSFGTPGHFFGVLCCGGGGGFFWGWVCGFWVGFFVVLF